MKRALLFLLFAGLLHANPRIPEKTLICGVCRDVETRLPRMISIMERIGALFEDHRILVYENNSTDRTPWMLQDWASKNKNVRIKSDTFNHQMLQSFVINEKEGTFFRPELIARARNQVLDMAMSGQYSDFPYVIWVDMDFVLPPAYEGVVEVFQSGREWDAVFAYGVDPPGTYWDWYAFRDAVYPIGSELLGDWWWYQGKQFSLHRGNDWYPVHSAFGGCGIYKKSSIVGCQYSAYVTEDLETLMKKYIAQGRETGHPQIMKYLSDLNLLNQIVKIDRPAPGLPKISNPHTGIILHDRPDRLIWKMNFFTYQYPSVCEHVPFHASMILKGHDKLFINPRLVFTYGGDAPSIRVARRGSP